MSGPKNLIYNYQFTIDFTRNVRLLAVGGETAAFVRRTTRWVDLCSYPNST